MSDARRSTKAAQDAVTDELLRPPTLVTEHMVMFGTAASVRQRLTRIVSALAVLTVALYPPLCCAHRTWKVARPHS